MHNRLTTRLAQNGEKLLSIYYCAGYPRLNDTLTIAVQLERAGVDLIEIGFPFSDPIADGEVIQAANQQALAHGMSLAILFEQLQQLRPLVSIPVLLMGYLNPILQYGIQRFCQDAAQVGIDGIIIPDLPLAEYKRAYAALFEKYQLSTIFLVTPHTRAQRIRELDRYCTGFIYAVSSPALTGERLAASEKLRSYLSSIKALQLASPFLVGFGIGDKVTLGSALELADGAIIGSRFIEVLRDSKDLSSAVPKFIEELR